ncbi:tetratricopeptide repeat protein [Streptomyces sp. 4N509B]|uniref:tetratricopeptide repeat protein n=1 Tax=Streptomyces sp. 4N509B TaxID=3457413 RepID=UPI003FCFAFC9
MSEEGTVTERAGEQASATVTTALLGRREELAALHADVERAGLDTLAGRPVPRARVLLVAGRPGSGRTALAEEFAGRMLASGAYPDGLLRARLTDPDGRPVTTERTVRELLGHLGLGAPAGADEDDLTAELREALDRRRTVLLLDDVASGTQLDGLLPDTRDCLVIAVSHGPLTGVPDVRPCTLGGLRGTPAVRLLARGAGDVRVTVDPTAAERLAEACGHLPAALVLVSGWLAAHPEAAVVDALRRMAEPAADGLDDLGDSTGAVGDEAGESVVGATIGTPGASGVPRTGGASGTSGMHGMPGMGGISGASGTARAEGPEGMAGGAAGPAVATPAVDVPLRRAFRMVHAMLPTPAARLLRLLALAPLGIADAQTAAALVGSPTDVARSLLADLAGAGLLHPTRPRPAPGTPAAAEPSYRVPGCLHPLLTALLRTREKSADALLAQARMLERTVTLLRACEAVTEPPGTPARTWLASLPATLRFGSAASADAWLAARRPELLAAARLAATDGELDTLARRLIAALGRALVTHRGEDDAAPDLYRLNELVLGVTERQRLPREQATALLSLGDLDAGAGRPTEALDRYRAALEAARTHRDPDPAAGRALISLGDTYADLGDWQRAADWYGRALAHAQSRGDLAGAARLHGRIGTVLGRVANWQEALRSWRASAAAYRRLGDVHAQAEALAEAALVQRLAGWLKDSQRTARLALRQAGRTGDEQLQAALRLRLAGRLEEAGRGLPA